MSSEIETTILVDDLKELLEKYDIALRTLVVIWVSFVCWFRATSRVIGFVSPATDLISAALYGSGLQRIGGISLTLQNRLYSTTNWIKYCRKKKFYKPKIAKRKMNGRNAYRLAYRQEYATSGNR